MGGSWWWVRVRSEQEVLGTFAWVEVVTDPETVDLFDPALAGQEISRSEFEEHWVRARQADAGL